MVDYKEIPRRQEADYGLYLVRKSSGLTWEFLDSVRAKLLSTGGVLSLERLFKDRKTVLCLFGPKNILKDLMGELRLLELEDYTAGISYENMDIWEVGTKGSGETLENTDNIFAALPKLYKEDQFFWQVALGDKRVQIRAAIFSNDTRRRKIFANWFENLAPGVLIKVPRPYSNEQMFDFFRLRSLGRDTEIPVLGSKVVMRLLKI